MINSLQILRGVAALLVVCAHIQPQVERMGATAFGGLGAGGIGVDIFFVISGFIIWVTSQSPRLTPGTFLQRRVIRVVPLYWLTTAFVAGVALFAPSVMSSTVFNLRHVVASFSFAPYPHPVLGLTYPILVPGWSLNYEMFFYVLFGIVLMLGNRLLVLFACLAVLVSLSSAGLLLAPDSVVLQFYTDPIMLEFAFGLVVGALYTHAGRPSLAVGVAAFIGGIAALLAASFAGQFENHHIRFLSVGIPAAAIVFGLTVAKRHDVDPSLTMLCAIGDASYSIYLSHVIVIPIGARLWSLLKMENSVPEILVFIVFELLLSASIGWLLHQAVERPITTFLRRQTTDKVKMTKTVPFADRAS